MADMADSPPKRGSVCEKYPALELEVRPRVPTAQASFYTSYAQQTLRDMHSRGSYDPRLDPIKLGNKILWSTAGIRAVLGVGRNV